MAIQRCKRPLESESDESPSTPRTSPHKKRLRARSNTPDTPLRLLSSPSTRGEKSPENRCTTPESEEEDDVQRTVPTPEKETKDEHTPPTTPNRAAEEEHTPPAPEQEVAVGDAQPTPSASPSRSTTNERCLSSLPLRRTVERTILPVVHKRADWPGLAGFKNWAILCVRHPSPRVNVPLTPKYTEETSSAPEGRALGCVPLDTGVRPAHAQPEMLMRTAVSVPP